PPHTTPLPYTDALPISQRAARENDHEAFLEFRRLSGMGEPQSLRELIRIKAAAAPVNVEEVEPAAEIVKRFVSTAMSLGALSPEDRKSTRLNSSHGSIS